jgi:DNA-directed RNA polymerase subunit M/transcription elongation factor TFIIS
MSTEAEPPQQWYVRTADGKRYGPLSFDALGDWIRQDRLHAGTQVSLDDLLWTPLDAVTGLGADWIVVEQDYYGPLSRSVIEHLVHAGAILPGARIRNVRTGEETVLDNVRDVPESKGDRMAKTPPIRTRDGHCGPAARTAGRKAKRRIACPACGDTCVYGRRRPSRVRLLVWTRQFECDKCGYEFRTGPAWLGWPRTVRSSPRPAATGEDPMPDLTCPQCAGATLHREVRPRWAKFLPSTRCYTCDSCGCRFVALFNVIKRHLS